jgi:hypothetical protein
MGAGREVMLLGKCFKLLETRPWGSAKVVEW